MDAELEITSDEILYSITDQKNMWKIFFNIFEAYLYKSYHFKFLKAVFYNLYSVHSWMLLREKCPYWKSFSGKTLHMDTFYAAYFITNIPLLIYIKINYLHSDGENGSSLAFKNNIGTLMFSNGFIVKDALL